MITETRSRCTLAEQPPYFVFAVILRTRTGRAGVPRSGAVSRMGGDTGSTGRRDSPHQMTEGRDGQ